jgi:hypothetical protein
MSLAVWHRKIRRWISHTASFRGLESVIADLKLMSQAARRAWILHEDPNHWIWLNCPNQWSRSQNLWAQVSYLGRALPSGVQRQEDEALAQHRADLTSVFITDAKLLAELQSWVNRWARRYLPRKPSLAHTMSFLTGDSATYEKSRRQGGLTSAMSEILGSSDVVVDPELPDDYPSSHALFGEIRNIAAILSSEWPPLPRGRIAAVRERGLKVRIVTATQPHALLLGHLARRRLMMGLRHFSMTRTALLGKPREVLKELIGCTGKVLSSDLRAASDLIPLDVAAAVVEGLRSSKRFLPCELHGLVLCTGPQDLDWTDGSRSVTTRGLLMGSPTTWAILTLIHGFCWDRVVHVPNSSVIHGRAGARIFGDDCIAIAEPDILHSYERSLLAVGFEINERKHFLSPDRGVFLEVLWTTYGKRMGTVVDGIPIRRKCSYLTSKGKKKQVLRVINARPVRMVRDVAPHPSVPLRGLVSGTTVSEHGREVEAPEWFAVPQVESTLLKQGFSARRIHAISKALRPGLPNQYQRLGIPPYLPRSLGGAGLCPPPWGFSVAPNHRRALANLLYATKPLDLESFEKCWAECVPGHWRQMALDDTLAESYFGHTWTVTVLPDRPSMANCDWLPLGDPTAVRVGVSSLMAQCHMSMLGPETSHMRFPGLSTVAKRLTRIRDGLTSKWKSATPVSKTVPELVARWAVLRRSLCLWVPQFLPTDLFSNTPGQFVKANDYLAEHPSGSFLHHWRRIALAATSREDYWWNDYIIPPGVFPDP